MASIDDFSAVAFDSNEYYPPQATVSLAETNLLIPNSPSSIESVKDEEDKKPTRKRKSWGQELPTPKTNLPPRKRAKTEDEKEQRRIERVLRNRQAAQSSRERKRLEVEKLEGEKQAIEHQNQILRERLMAVEHEKFKLGQKLARMKAEMSSIGYNRSGKRITSTVSSVTSSPSPQPIPHEGQIKEELDDYTFALPTPRYSTAESSSSFSTPASSYSRSPTPIGYSLNTISSSSDLTQHPAAMLCGLQCQSEAACLISAPLTTPDEVRQRVQIMILCQLLYLTLISAIFSHMLNPLRMMMVSLQRGSPLSSKTSPSTPLISVLTNWLTLRPANYNRRTKASFPIWITNPTNLTLTRSAPQTPTNSQALLLSMTSKSSLINSLLHNLLVCSPALARPLKDATDRAMRPKSSSKLNGNSSDSVSKRARGRRVVVNVGEIQTEATLRKDVVVVVVPSAALGCITKNPSKRKRRLVVEDEYHCTTRSKRIKDA